MKKLDNSGFTLIELIATIVLLGVLAVISFVSITAVIENSKVKNCQNLVSSIKNASKEYVSDNRYSNGFDSDNNLIINILASDLINGDYLSSPIVNPFDNKSIIDGDDVDIKIELNDDYTAKMVIIEAPSILRDCGIE